MRNIFVGNHLIAELHAAFAQHGNVERVNIITQRDTGLPRGFAFVQMSDDANVALVDGNLGPAASPKLLGCWFRSHVPTAQIEEITSLATAVLEDGEKAVRWLSMANPATDDRAPIELIGEPQGFERVKNLLLRIEYGVLA